VPDDQAAAPQTTASSSGKRAYRFQEYLETYGVGKQTTYEAIARGELIAHKRGRATIILADDAERYHAALPRVDLPPPRERTLEERAPKARRAKPAPAHAGA
jgi:hypothetical protein